MKHILILPDGSRIGSGPGTVTAIKSVTLTRTVNDGASLTPGAAVASELEVSLFTPGGSLALTAGQEVQLLRTDDAGNEHPLGIFLLEKPLRPSPNTMRLTGFDRLVKLDKDLTDWLSGLTGWPYPLLTFAQMVCAACGVTLATADIPNAGYPISRFTREGVTGRQLIRWLGEIACRFCVANEDGALEFGWYTDSGICLAPSGENFYFQNGLSYEDYTLAPPDGVQLRLGEGEDGYLWPPAQGEHPYIITGNPLLSAVTPQTESALQTMARELSGLGYTPCKVTVPAASPIQPGHRFTVTTPRGETIAALVMTRTDAPGKTTLEAAGSPRGSTADKPLGQLMQEAADRAQQTAVSAAAADAANKANAALSDAKTYADSAASNAVNAQTQADIFNKLTNNGQLPGLFMSNGQLYINADYLSTGVISSADGTVQLDLGNNSVTVNGTRNGKKTQLVLSSSGLDGYGESSEGVMEHVLSLLMGVGGLPTGLWNLAWQESRGLSIGSATGRTTIGTSEAGTRIFGGSVEIDSPVENVKILGKNVFWKDNGNGTFNLIGREHQGETNPGKAKLFTGNVTMGNTCTVPNTDLYDLFAIKLWDGYTTYDTMVLAYKTGNVVRGVGGWAGTATESKQLFFFSATVSGDTWKLEDAGFHYVYIGGTVEEGIRLNLKEVIGVI